MTADLTARIREAFHKSHNCLPDCHPCVMDAGIVAAAVEPLLSAYQDVAKAAQDHLDGCCGWADKHKDSQAPDLKDALVALARLQGDTDDGT